MIFFGLLNLIFYIYDSLNLFRFSESYSHETPLVVYLYLLFYDPTGKHFYPKQFDPPGCIVAPPVFIATTFAILHTDT